MITLLVYLGLTNKKILGFYFGNDLSNDDHWNKNVTKLMNTLLLWKRRNLPLISKSHVINLLANSKIWYTATVTNLPKHYETLINRNVFTFLWNSKFEPLARAVCINPLDKGGLNITHVRCKIQALRIQHIQKLLDDDYSAKWKDYARYWIGLQLRSFNPNLGLNKFSHTLYVPNFYPNSRTCAFYYVLSINMLYG